MSKSITHGISAIPDEIRSKVQCLSCQSKYNKKAAHRWNYKNDMYRSV